jgi:septum formation protein
MYVRKRLVLASRSPRRLSLFRQIGLAVDVVPSDIQEEFDPKISAIENARRLSLDKARDVGNTIDDAFVVGADTIVTIDGQLLGKPEDAVDALRMLEILSGRTHTVHTAFALLDRPTNKSVAGVESTLVTFRQLPREEIEEYVKSGAPMDKAGAYGIQDDYGAVFVTRIEGCYYNVVGFPLARFYTTLQHFQMQFVS